MTLTTTDICRHCRFGIPDDATICPGCGRRHEPRALGSVHRGRSPLLHLAQWTRRLLIVTGLMAVAFGVVALARYGAGLGRVTPNLSHDVPGRLARDTQLLAKLTLLALGLTIGCTAWWARHLHRNLPALDLQHQLLSPWSLLGWMVPGRTARRRKLGVDADWRDRSPLVAALPASGWSRRPVSQVVLRWWALWLWAPAAIVLVAIVVDSRAAGAPALGGELALVGVAAAALVVATVRAMYDVVGILTVAQAHRAERVSSAQQVLTELGERHRRAGPGVTDHLGRRQRAQAAAVLQGAVPGDADEEAGCEQVTGAGGVDDLRDGLGRHGHDLVGLGR